MVQTRRKKGGTSQNHPPPVDANVIVQTPEIEVAPIQPPGEIIVQPPAPTTHELLQLINESKADTDNQLKQILALITQGQQQQAQGIITTPASTVMSGSDNFGGLVHAPPAAECDVVHDITQPLPTQVTSVSLPSTQFVSLADSLRPPRHTFPRIKGGSDSDIIAAVGLLDKIYESGAYQDTEFIGHVAEKLEGDPDDWYRTSGRLHKSYSDFRSDLLNSLLTPNYKFAIEAALRNQLQSHTELFGPFCRSVWRQFMDICPHIPESEVVNILLKNTNPALVQFMKFTGMLTTVKQLIEVGKVAEVALLNAQKYQTTMQPPAPLASMQPPPPPPHMQPPPAPPVPQHYASAGDLYERGRRKLKTCYLCGSSMHLQAACPQNRDRRSSSASHTVCERCGGTNHRAAVCRARLPRSASQSNVVMLN